MKGLIKGKKYIIVGFVKCGTTSLEHYLKSKGYDVIRYETLYCAGEKHGWHSYDPFEWYESRHKDRVPIFITRDKAEQIESHVKYKQSASQRGDVHALPSGDVWSLIKKNPHILEHCCHEKYFSLWEKYNYVHIKFEEMILMDGFPQLNKT